MQHAPAFNHKVTFNRLEAWDADEGTGHAWEGSAWFGTDTDRLWLRSEGERVGGHTESADLEVLYGRSVSPWWDVLVGVKQDLGPGDSRAWAALGIQGLAPYKFETSATAYVGEGGQVMASAEIEYELLLTNRLILQPTAELNFYAQNDPQRRVGSGLSESELGLRLRYEVRREFAPYVGVSWNRSYGQTAQYARDEDEDVSQLRWVVGVRLWF